MQILVIDDEKNIRRTMAMAIESMEHEVVSVASGAEAFKELRSAAFQVVFLDLKLHQENGLEVLTEILRLAPQAAVVIITAFASIETAVEAMRLGAFDYLPKPCTPDQVRQLLVKIERTKRLENRVLELETQINAESPEVDLATDSPLMQTVIDMAFKAANSDATVLILGESGTGKSVLARAMHARSPRKGAAFVTVSCPSLSRELLESELFGHVKGAFTGALADTAGKVAAADAKFGPDLNDFSQIVSANLISGSENDRSLDEISQFAEIAWPAVRSHRFKRSQGEAAKLFSSSVGKKIEMPLCNPLQVLESFAQRR